ncbi:hypothetical protein CABS01_11434 [Colletotrichum abscissum]|uniref:uncharacterized protein n=1 Tax=Colletotrichum abscissum TaxID=1671311 RepID=UPI0027D4B199|nr:uncharacterized protein CABS01_11434 [Colletotrichum abscissum]KAK1494418.1 hypothetical protein CABS01_11434 [Colletotrichum abscissum]
MEGPMKRRGTATGPDGPKDPIGNRAYVSTNEQKRSGGSKMNQDGTPNAPGRNVHPDLTCLLCNWGLLYLVLMVTLNGQISVRRAQESRK